MLPFGELTLLPLLYDIKPLLTNRSVTLSRKEALSDERHGEPRRTGRDERLVEMSPVQLNHLTGEAPEAARETRVTRHRSHYHPETETKRATSSALLSRPGLRP